VYLSTSRKRCPPSPPQNKPKKEKEGAKGRGKKLPRFLVVPMKKRGGREVSMPVDPGALGEREADSSSGNAGARWPVPLEKGDLKGKVSRRPPLRESPAGGGGGGRAARKGEGGEKVDVPPVLLRLVWGPWEGGGLRGGEGKRGVPGISPLGLGKKPREGALSVTLVCRGPGPERGKNKGGKGGRGGDPSGRSPRPMHAVVRKKRGKERESVFGEVFFRHRRAQKKKKKESAPKGGKGGEALLPSWLRKKARLPRAPLCKEKKGSSKGRGRPPFPGAGETLRRSEGKRRRKKPAHSRRVDRKRRREGGEGKVIRWIPFSSFLGGGGGGGGVGGGDVLHPSSLTAPNQGGGEGGRRRKVVPVFWRIPLSRNAKIGRRGEKKRRALYTRSF